MLGQSEPDTRQPRGSGHASRGTCGTARCCGGGGRAPTPDANGRQAAGDEEKETRISAVPEAARASEGAGRLFSYNRMIS